MGATASNDKKSDAPVRVTKGRIGVRERAATNNDAGVPNVGTRIRKSGSSRGRYGTRAAVVEAVFVKDARVPAPPPGYTRATREFTNTVGGAVRALRRLSGLTQTQLAEQTGIAQPDISAIENDRVELSVQRARRIAAVFGVYPGLLLFPDWPYSDEDARGNRR